jgi:drug/metabolite transporter (DMT)-like permease
MTSNDGRPTMAAIFMLIGIILAFGLGWPIMKYGVVELPVLTFRWLTAIFSGIVVLVFARVMGEDIRLPRSEWRIAAICALFNVTGWFLFTAIGLTLLTAGRAVVLAYSMPLWAFLVGLVIGRERASFGRIFGISCGLGTIAVLTFEDFGTFREAPLGVLAILGAAASWGVGTVIQKRVWKTPPMTLAAWQLLIGGVPLVLLALTFDEDPYRDLTSLGVFAVVYTVIIGNMCGFALWIRVLNIVSTPVASLGVLPVPLIGVLSGAVVLGEPVGFAELAALGLITLALGSVLPMPRFLASRPR